jgi:hypothetical protein
LDRADGALPIELRAVKPRSPDALAREGTVHVHRKLLARMRIAPCDIFVNPGYALLPLFDLTRHPVNLHPDRMLLVEMHGPELIELAEYDCLD